MPTERRKVQFRTSLDAFKYVAGHVIADMETSVLDSIGEKGGLEGLTPAEVRRINWAVREIGWVVLKRESQLKKRARPRAADA
jgi:hypothetical protein